MKRILILAALIGFLTQCGQSSQQGSSTQQTSTKVEMKKNFEGSELTKEAQSLAQRVNAFNDALFPLLRKGKEDQNIFYSAFSIHQALAMVLPGSGGNTQKELLKGLGLPENREPDSLGKDYYNLCGELLKSLSKTDQLDIANSIWIDEQIKVKEPYQEALEKYFNISLFDVDLQKKEDLKRINGWVKEITHGNIGEVVKEDPLDSDLMAILLNVLYFKGDWAIPFKESETKEEDFTLKNGNKVKTQMMSARYFFAYTENENLQLLKMNYEGRNYSMVVVLPRMGYELKSSDLQEQSLKQLLKVAYQEEVILSFPKFSLEFEMRMVKILEKLGIRELFDIEKADLKGISDTPLRIGDVIHKTKIIVNEKSTEASALTGIELTKDETPTIQEKKLYEFRADHPFYFFIQENFTGTILFSGMLMNPAEK